MKWFNFRWQKKTKGQGEKRKTDRCSTEIKGGRESLCWHLVGSARKKIRVGRSELRGEWRQWDMEQTGVVLKALQLIDRMRACLAIQGRVSRHWRSGEGYRTCLCYRFYCMTIYPCICCALCASRLMSLFRKESNKLLRDLQVPATCGSLFLCCGSLELWPILTWKCIFKFILTTGIQYK